MLDLREHRANVDRLCDLLPWAALVAPGVVLNKDGSFQRTLRYRGPDLDSATKSELVSTTARINNVLRRLGSGWAIYSEAQRKECTEYPKSEFPDPVSYLIDEERKALFEDQRHYESTYYMTLIYLPPSDGSNKLTSVFIDDSTKEGLDYREVLTSFQNEVDRILDLFCGTFPEVEPLNDEETLTYLHDTISEKSHPIKAPDCPMYLDALLSDTPLTTGFEPKLGKKAISAISVRGFPGKSIPGILDRLNRLPIQYRWMTRFIFLDKHEAEKEISSYKRKWFAKRKGVLTLLKETFTGTESVMADSDAVLKAEDADTALQILQDDAVAFGYFTATIILSDEDQERLASNAREVERVINGLGFATRIEDVNAVDAWLGSIPGNCRNNVRRPMLHTLNLAHLMPVSAVWAGPERDEHFDAPVLLYGLTNGSTKFRFSTKVGDVGHTLILGPTGAGKSVFLNLIEAQFLRYPDAQVYIFDKGGSSRVLTWGVGGEYYDLGAEDSKLCFQPLSDIDKPSELRWAQEWLLEILLQEKINVTPSVKEELWVALSSLASAPREQRTIYGLTVLLQDHELRQALNPYTVNGPHGALLDESQDTLQYARWQAFEMEVLMETPSVVMPVLRYLFHRLEQRFTGAPTLLVLDEAWLFLDNPAFSQKIREWLKVLRKANVSVVFATQSLADVDGSSIAPTLKEACLTKVYLPNTAALNEDAYAFYEKFGLNDTQIRILAESIPKRHYYYTSSLGNRLFELGLGEIALAYCGATSKELQTKAKRIFQSSPNRTAFNREYLHMLGIDWAAQSFQFLSPQTKLDKEAA